MDCQAERRRDSGERQPKAEYEPPRVEQVVTLAELEREILYAGAVGASADA
jgi:hypothetical protein